MYKFPKPRNIEPEQTWESQVMADLAAEIVATIDRQAYEALYHGKFTTENEDEKRL